MDSNTNHADNEANALIHFEQGEELFNKFQKTGDLEDLEKAVDCKIKCVSSTPEGNPNMSKRIESLITSWETQCNHSREFDKLIECSARVLCLIPEVHTELPRLLNNQGMMHQARFQRLRSLPDLIKAIECVQGAHRLASEGYHWLPRFCGNLSALYQAKFKTSKDMNDLEKAITYATQGSSITPEGAEELPNLFYNLAILFSNKFDHQNDLSDLEKAIEYGIRAHACTPEDHPGLSALLGSLGRSYNKRHNKLGALDDLEKSIEFLVQTCSITPEGHPDRPMHLYCLGNLYLDRFRHLHDTSDLSRAIETLDAACSLISDNHSEIPRLLSELGDAYHTRYMGSRDLNDLSKAIQCQTRACSKASEGHPSLLQWLKDLITLYDKRYNRLRELDDLNKKIDYSRELCSLLPADDPELASHLNRLAVSYYGRFRQLGNIEDLNEGIDYHDRARAVATPGAADLPLYVANVGALYRERAIRFNNLDDLDKAIQHTIQALSMAPDDYGYRAEQLHNLGLSYSYRYQYLGELGDFNKSFDYYNAACSLGKEDDQDMPRYLAGLATSYSSRFSRLGNIEDLNMAIEHGKKMCSLVSDNNNNRTRLLNGLGALYERRYSHLGDMDDLELAISYYSQAHLLTPEGHPELPDCLDKLGDTSRARFKKLGTIEDLNKAIEFSSKACSLTPEGHPDLVDHFHGLGLAYVEKYKAVQGRQFWDQAENCFRQAYCSPVGRPRRRLDTALKWARISTQYYFSNPIHAYSIAIELLPQLVWLGATIDQRYLTLGTLSNLASEAASVAIQYSQPDLALEWLEQGRSIVWNQTLLLRSPLEELRSQYPALAENIGKTGNELHRTSSRILDVAQHHHSLAKDYAEQMERVRELPGFSSFLKPKTVKELVHAARSGPIVIINCYKSSCDALIIRPGEQKVAHLPLPKFSGLTAQDARSELAMVLADMRQRDARRPYQSNDHISMNDLVTLWECVAKPVLDFLVFTPQPSSDGLPRLTWCTTGALSFLPLHAAGDYSLLNSNVSACVISSYTPTLSALLSLKQGNGGSGHTSILAVGQEETPGLTRLPGTRQELAYIQGRTNSLVRFTEISGHDATTASVLNAMEDHDWVHLRCHASQNAKNATGSGFFMYDGSLELKSIIQKSFKNKGLAFLSACQTAQGDENLPDEAVHLASGMLMAGYPSVIASMWAVGDQDAPLVADRVYSELLKDGEMRIEDTAKALHNAVIELREKIGAENYIRWAQYIHIGL